jgi:Putative MetA-pathway of phenol degradation
MLQPRHFVLSSVLVFILVSFGLAQGGPCPVATSTKTSTILPRSGDLICLVPQVYGGGGLVGTDHGGPLDPTNAFGHTVHFSASSLAGFNPLNAEIGTQLSQLPFASPASGFIFTFNPSMGVVTRQTESFGPILTERAETVGRHKLFVGASYQYFNFDQVDGVNLRSFNAVFTHEDESSSCQVPNPPAFLECGSDGKPRFQHDFIGTQNRIDLKVHQVTFVSTFGVTNRLDLSVAVPILDVRMSMSSSANITSFESFCALRCIHRFNPSNPADIPTHESFISTSNAIFFDNGSASGIGDVVFRGKFQALKAEKAGLAVGVDVRLPTGDEENFLGSGTYGTRPFVVFSYAGRISPHASAGYEINGNSILAGDITRHVDAHLPNVITYSAGADAGVTRRVSLSVDFLGQALQNARKMLTTTYTDPFVNVTQPNITTTRATVNQASIAVGGKFNPVAQLLFTANVLFRLNDAGLHSKPVPLVGVSYTF